MAVPDTTTFSLQDVVNEVVPTTDDLLDCVADASPGSYDVAYYTAPATSLLEFRNYNSVPGVAFDIAATGAFSSASACVQAVNTVNYTSSADSSLSVGGFVYTDDALTNLKNGGNNFFRYGAGTSSMKIDSLGEITVITGC